MATKRKRILRPSTERSVDDRIVHNIKELYEMNNTEACKTYNKMLFRLSMQFKIKQDGIST
jgi:hypothetical protein